MDIIRAAIRGRHDLRCWLSAGQKIEKKKKTAQYTRVILVLILYLYVTLYLYALCLSYAKKTISRGDNENNNTFGVAADGRSITDELRYAILLPRYNILLLYY